MSAYIKKKHCKTATTKTRHSQGTQELVVYVQRDASSGGIVGALAGWRARHPGLVSYLAQDGVTLCIEPRGKLRPMCMRMYVKMNEQEES